MLLVDDSRPLSEVCERVICKDCIMLARFDFGEEVGVATYFDTCAPEVSGNGTSSRRIFAKVAFLFLPLNGVVPNNIS